MKKIISVLLLTAMLLTASACGINSGKGNGEGGGETVSTEPYSEKILRDKTVKNEYKAADGTVTYVVDAVLPEVFGLSEGICDTINTIFNTIVTEAGVLAQANVEHAANYMKSFGLDKPWTRTVRYEIKFCNARYLCIVISDKVPLTADTELVARTFDLMTGNMISLSELETDGITGLDESVKSEVISALIAKAESLAGAQLTDEQIANLKKEVDFGNFWFDEFQFGVLMPMSKISPDFAGKGYTEASFFLSDYGMEIPEK